MEIVSKIKRAALPVLAAASLATPACQTTQVATAEMGTVDQNGQFAAMQAPAAIRTRGGNWLQTEHLAEFKATEYPCGTPACAPRRSAFGPLQASRAQVRTDAGHKVVGSIGQGLQGLGSVGIAGAAWDGKFQSRVSASANGGAGGNATSNSNATGGNATSNSNATATSNSSANATSNSGGQGTTIDVPCN